MLRFLLYQRRAVGLPHNIFQLVVVLLAQCKQDMVGCPSPSLATSESMTGTRRPFQTSPLACLKDVLKDLKRSQILTKFWRGNWPNLAWSHCAVRCPEAQSTHRTFVRRRLHAVGAFYFLRLTVIKKALRNHISPEKGDRADFNRTGGVFMMLIGFC